MMTDSVNALVDRGELLPLDRVYPNRLNPNEMNIENFDYLCFQLECSVFS